MSLAHLRTLGLDLLCVLQEVSNVNLLKRSLIITPRDPKWIRSFVSRPTPLASRLIIAMPSSTVSTQVFYLFVVETINIGCNIATIYEPLVTQYGLLSSRLAPYSLFPNIYSYGPGNSYPCCSNLLPHQ
jgi:hypothetical protein